MALPNPRPAISVVIPTYNRAHLLPRAIQSVLSQGFAEFELIVVDDNSTDDTPQVIETFSDPRLIYMRQARNGGAAAARNMGIRRARGQYVAFLDDDDEYLPPFLAETHRAFSLAPPSVGLSWCGIRSVEMTPTGEKNRGERLWQPAYASREQAYLAFLHSRRIGTNCGVTVRRACFETVGLFDEALPKAEDTDFLTRLVRQFDFVVIPRMLVKVHRHTGPKLTVYDHHMAAAYEHILQKNLPTLQGHPSLWAALHYKTGWLYYHAGNKARGRHFMRQALARRPFRLKAWLALLMFELFGSQAPRLHRRLSGLKMARRSG